MKSLLFITLIFNSFHTISAEPELSSFFAKHKILQAIEPDHIGKLVWNDDNTAVAFCVAGKINQCFIVDSQFAVDVSQIEQANIGKLGLYSKQDYEKVVSFPHKWLRTGEGRHLVSFKTQAWRDGQRFTVSEPTLVENGKYKAR